MTGLKFGRLTVLERAEDKVYPSGDKKSRWLCQCDCNSEPKIILSNYLTQGKTKSCGCIVHEGNHENLIGKKFGKWKVVEEAKKNNKGEVQWLCECNCEKKTQKILKTYYLTSGESKSCGCITRNNIPHKNLIGKKFNELTVVGIKNKENLNDRFKWRCECSCGNKKEVYVTTNDLKSGKIKSCGCIRKTAYIQMGLNKTKYPKEDKDRIFNIWKGMLSRTGNPKSKHYQYYGGKGIVVCNEWKNDFYNFKKWALDNGYADKLTIERINNDLGYFPQNCKWADYYEQANNTSRNVYLTYNNKTATLSQWAKELNIKSSILSERYRSGWSTEEIITRPVKKNKSIIIEYEGETRTLTEWSKILNIHRNTLYYRYSKGFSAENILKKSVIKKENIK